MELELQLELELLLSERDGLPSLELVEGVREAGGEQGDSGSAGMFEHPSNIGEGTPSEWVVELELQLELELVEGVRDLVRPRSNFPGGRIAIIRSGLSSQVWGSSLPGISWGVMGCGNLAPSSA